MKAFKLAAAWAAAGLGFLATPAHADWRFTQWGMTADEVVAASKGEVGPRDPEAMATDLATKERIAAAGYSPSPNTCTLRLLEPLMIADITFNDVQFCFSKAGRLSLVLTRSGSSAREVSNALAQALGPPVEVVRGEFPAWTYVDRERGNALELRPHSSGGSSIAYTKLASGF